MNPEIARVLGEARIVRSRPIGVGLAAVGLEMISLDVALMSPMFLLTGLFANPSILMFGLSLLVLAATCLVIGIGLYPGHLWAWCGMNILCVPLAVLVWWTSEPFDVMSWWTRGVGLTYLGVLSAILGLLLVAVEILLWSPPVRKWFFQSHGIRRGRFEDVAQELLSRDSVVTRTEGCAVIGDLLVCRLSRGVRVRVAGVDARRASPRPGAASARRAGHASGPGPSPLSRLDPSHPEAPRRLGKTPGRDYRHNAGSRDKDSATATRRSRPRFPCPSTNNGGGLPFEKPPPS